MEKGVIRATCISAEKGTEKQPVRQVLLKTDWGMEGDAHAGHWHRQVSLLAKERIDAFNAEGAGVSYGEFGENIVTEGFDPTTFPVGSIIQSGDVVLQVTQIGKECHSGCAIQKRMGRCIMPQNGVFAKVLCGGVLRPGDPLVAYREIRVAVICLSDRCSKGEAEDLSSPVIVRLCRQAGFSVVSQTVLPDGIEPLASALKEICDKVRADLVLTTGGTGLSPRDLTPEATASVLERDVPGIAEAMRSCALAKTPRAMLSRARSVIRGQTLLVNLPGSPKAVEENLSVILPVLDHAVMTLKGVVKNCAIT
ncbi:MAG: molybdenum cofactor synthesis domain-containing protein [Sphaerochaetaceae bacterium]